jgi:hypothetical protein
MRSKLRAAPRGVAPLVRWFIMFRPAPDSQIPFS